MRRKCKIGLIYTTQMKECGQHEIELLHDEQKKQKALVSASHLVCLVKNPQLNGFAMITIPLPTLRWNFFFSLSSLMGPHPLLRSTSKTCYLLHLHLVEPNFIGFCFLYFCAKQMDHIILIKVI